MEALETSAARGKCLGQSNHYIIIMAVFERRVVNKTECGGREREWESNGSCQCGNRQKEGRRDGAGLLFRTKETKGERGGDKQKD